MWSVFVAFGASCLFVRSKISFVSELSAVGCMVNEWN